MSPFLVLRFARPLGAGEVSAVLRALAVPVPDWADASEQGLAICAVPSSTAPDPASIEAVRSLGVSHVAFIDIPAGVPQHTNVGALPFVIDGYPDVIDEVIDAELGLAVKLVGPARPGVEHVLAAFRALWLSAYDAREQGGVTFDRKRNAAHFWLDGRDDDVSHEQRVHHLVWIAARLHEVVPLLHARFAEPAAAQKLGGLLGPRTEPFVLAGNPLLAAYASDGDLGVRRWIDVQTDWSREEVAAMLRELAIDLAATEPGDGDHEHDDDDEHEHDENGDDELAEDDDDDDDDDDDGARDADQRDVTGYAGELLRERAAAGLLHARAADKLVPILATPERYEQRRLAVVEILGAARHRAALPALLRILETTVIRSALDAIGKDDLIAATATALGALGDAQAVGALARLVAMPGNYYDRVRGPAGQALASCVERTPDPSQPGDAVLRALLTTICERDDGELNADAHLAYGVLAARLDPDRRDEAYRRLADADTARDDTVAMLARHAALVLASPTTPVQPPSRELQQLLHDSLSSLAYDHEYTVRNVRVALRVAALIPAVVDPADLLWLTRFAEPDIRTHAHALLATHGRATPEAPTFDVASVRARPADELVRLLGEPHLIGRAAVIGEIGRRGLTEARRLVIAACHDVVSRARPGGESLLEPDLNVLDAGISFLHDLALDDETNALFERILRHPNVNVRDCLAHLGMDSN